MGKPIEYEVDNNGCHICTSHTVSNSGYTVLMVNGKRHLAHRYVYEKAFGEIPEGYFVSHKCHNKLCVNPDHLELITQAGGIRDKRSQL